MCSVPCGCVSVPFSFGLKKRSSSSSSSKRPRAGFLIPALFCVSSDSVFAAAVGVPRSSPAPEPESFRGVSSSSSLLSVNRPCTLLFFGFVNNPSPAPSPVRPPLAPSSSLSSLESNRPKLSAFASFGCSPAFVFSVVPCPRAECCSGGRAPNKSSLSSLSESESNRPFCGPCTTTFFVGIRSGSVEAVSFWLRLLNQLNILFELVDPARCLFQKGV